MFYEDGMATTVTVDRWDKVYSLKNNGKVDASNDADMPTQIVVGLLPFLFYSQPHPPKAALVGYGSGVTAGAMTQYPIASLEIVELEAAVYRGARFFDNDNHRPLQNPKVTARVGDGRNFLTQRSDKFDVIVSEPSNPWLTGVSNLFTREYFKLVKTRLAEHGIFCQWAQLYEMSPWNIKTILGTVRAEFPYVYVFAAEDWSSDTILIGSLDPLPLDYDTSTARSAIRSRAPRRSAAASSRPTTCSPTCCSGPTSWRRSRPARPTTPTTTRASSSRRRAICSATPSSSRTAPTSTGRCGRTAACPSWCAATATAPTRAAAAGARAQPAGARQGARGGAVDAARGGGRRFARGAARPPVAQAGVDAADRDPEILLAPGEELTLRRCRATSPARTRSWSPR